MKATMKAIVLDRFGGPEVLRVADLPKPVPGEGQVLLKVTSAGVNFAETLMRKDRYAMTPPLPSVLGSELAGIAEAVGMDVAPAMIGKRYIAPLFAAGVHFGAYAEYALVDANWAVELPDVIDDSTGLALTVQGLSALHMVRNSDPRGKTVLITAAAGGVGTMLIQLARQMGAKRIIAAASSAGKRHFCLELGADAAIDYTEPQWVDQVLGETGGAGPDIIYESTGGNITKDCLKLLGSRGEIVIYGALNIQEFALGIPELLGLIFRNQSVTGFALAPLLTPDGIKEDLAYLFDLAASGGIRAHVGGTFPLAEAAEAHRLIENRATIGKVVLTP